MDSEYFSGPNKTASPPPSAYSSQKAFYSGARCKAFKPPFLDRTPTLAPLSKSGSAINSDCSRTAKCRGACPRWIAFHFEVSVPVLVAFESVKGFLRHKSRTSTSEPLRAASSTWLLGAGGGGGRGGAMGRSGYLPPRTATATPTPSVTYRLDTTLDGLLALRGGHGQETEWWSGGVIMSDG